ncbi:autotransporter outer membrane beta-barrel domain-containing protein [Stenotrophomonas sp. GD04006]|nr:MULTISPECIES: autotransporter outer membrane beta-barrel domain-containing protein [Stenotrophomonas]MDH0549679.1 autotransporter outer membrane beta-barrel domain-containing protein [Stenotrophomonas sp. GD04006]
MPRRGGVAGRIGARVFGHSMALGNRVQPYLGVNWLRGPATNALDFNGQTLAVGMPRDRVEVQGGAELELGERVGAWGGVSLQRADQNYRNIIGQVGIRVAW